MPTQPEEAVSEMQLIKFCKGLAVAKKHAEPKGDAKAVLSRAMALSLVASHAEGYQLTKEGKSWLRRKLSQGGLETQSKTEQSQINTINSESPLAWLKSRKDKTGRGYISELQFEAGERLREDFTYAHLWGTVRSNWRTEQSSRSSTKIDDVSDSVYNARDRLQRALSTVGPELSGVLMDVCCFLKSLKQVESERQWPQRTAKIVLGLALDRLATHYGSSRNRAIGPKNAQMASWAASNSELELQTHHP
ncbi:DUF6456 domain-containing protein [Pseudovibrio ascidiaceicola]|uniref:DUF6456 domain-containing protein n=1 Tax=Pseudovibrio ascidiaceicola TaxID=285279 RepID=UPI003D369F5C